MEEKFALKKVFQLNFKSKYKNYNNKTFTGNQIHGLQIGKYFLNKSYNPSQRKSI